MKELDLTRGSVPKVLAAVRDAFSYRQRASGAVWRCRLVRGGTV